MEPLYVDPRFITSSDWFGIARLVQFLWLVVIFNVGLAFFMLLSQAVVPSLIATGEIPRRLTRVRPVLTLVGIIAFAGTLVILLNWLGTLSVLYNIYPRRLI